MPKVVPLVFVSSTFRDLEVLRQQTVQALEKRELVWRGMERFGAQALTPADVIADQVQSCDLYIGILGYRYGSLVPGMNVSFTEYEYRLARDMDVDSIFFVADDANFLATPGMIDTDPQSRAQLERFKTEICNTHTVVRFTQANFQEELARSVATWLEERWRRRAEDMMLTVKPLEGHEKEWLSQLYSGEATKIADAVGTLGSNRLALEQFYALLRLGGPAVRAPIFLTLAQGNHFDDRAADILCEMMASSDAELREAAVRATGLRALKGKGRVPDRVLPLVLKLETDSHVAVRYEVAHALWRLACHERHRRPTCHLALLRLVGDSDLKVSERATTSLSRLQWTNKPANS